MASKRVLAVGVGQKTLESVRRGLVDDDHEVDLAPTAKSGLALAFELRFDLVLVGHPLPGLVVRDFVRQLQDDSSASRKAKLIVLAERADDEELHALKSCGVEVFARGEALIGDLTHKVLGGAPRARVGVMVRLELELPYGQSIRICQTENLSESGMLVRTEDTVPVGTPATASFRVRGGDGPIEASARVVRETTPGEIPGIALQFESFRGRSEARLKRFIATRLAS